MELARELTLRVALDTKLAVDVIGEAARRAGSTIGVLVDLDVGFHRTGVQSIRIALELAQHITKTNGLRFDGLFFYNGHLKSAAAPDAHAAALKEISSYIGEAIGAMSKAGLKVPIVSGGSTPTAFQSHYIPQLTEIRPGTYIFYDWNTAEPGQVGVEDCAAQLICTVVTDAVPGKVVLDAGSKTLTNDRLGSDPENGGYGHLPDYPEAKIVRLSEEHGEVDITPCARRPRLGERMCA